MLNAKQHAREAEIVAQAGRPGAITIATNMAGRGTDIVLGGMIEPILLAVREDAALGETEKRIKLDKLHGDWEVVHEKVKAAGGLHIVGTERHESRRIDNQLRGRSGRQGDAGSSRFYLSLEDPLLRIFGGERLGNIMQRLKMPEGEPIEHSIVNRSIAKAQNRVESRNFDIRKQLLEYDDVANDQRRVIYQQRNELLESSDISETVQSMIEGEIDAHRCALRAGRLGRGTMGPAGAGGDAGGRFPDSSRRSRNGRPTATSTAIRSASALR